MRPLSNRLKAGQFKAEFGRALAAVMSTPRLEAFTTMDCIGSDSAGYRWFRGGRILVARTDTRD